MQEAEEGKGHERGEHEQAAPSRTPDIQTRRPSLPIKRTQDAREIDRYISCTDLSRLVFMAETYMGHPLSITELNTIYYISNDLHFSVDLLEYLVEYCSEKGKKQIRYIEKVAVNWYEQGIDTVAKAMDQTALYGQNIFLIMKAFGISGRNPGQSEINYINHWNSLGRPLEWYFFTLYLAMGFPE